MVGVGQKYSNVGAEAQSKRGILALEHPTEVELLLTGTMWERWVFYFIFTHAGQSSSSYWGKTFDNERKEQKLKKPQQNRLQFIRDELEKYQITEIGNKTCEVQEGGLFSLLSTGLHEWEEGWCPHLTFHVTLSLSLPEERTYWGFLSLYSAFEGGIFNFFFPWSMFFCCQKLAFHVWVVRRHLCSPSSTTSLALCNELCGKCHSQDVPGAGTKVCPWEKLLNFLNIPGVLVSLGSIWVCMWKTLYCLLGRSTGKCSWYCFTVENAAEREVEGLFCTLCMLGWGAVITHISKLTVPYPQTQAVPNGQSKVDIWRSCWYLEINCPPAPLDGSTVLGFHPLPTCCKHAFLTTSHDFFFNLTIFLLSAFSKK